MKKILYLATLFLWLLPFSADALLLTFGPELDEGGAGTATMDVLIDGNTLTAVVNNTSPVNLDGELSGGNSPGIDGFGFNLDPEILSLIYWELEAYAIDENGFSILTIGKQNTGPWTMGNYSTGNISVEYYPNNDSGIDGALYNPSAFFDPNNTLPGGSNNLYYTTATLTMEFNREPILIIDSESPFVRMQNVGMDGEGSLKLVGTPVPEPATMVISSIFLLGAGFFVRRKLHGVY